MSISGVGSSGNTINVNQTDKPLTTGPSDPATGSGHINASGTLPPAADTAPRSFHAHAKFLVQNLPDPVPTPDTGRSSSRGSFDYDSVISMLGALMIEQVGHQRTQAMNQRAAGYEAAKSSSLQQAEEMKNAAAEMKQGAIKNMAIGITTAGVSIIGSGISLGKQLSAIKPAGAAMQKMTETQKALDAVTIKADNFTDIGRKVPPKLQREVESAQAAFKVAASESAEIDKSVDRFKSMAEITSRVGDIGRQLGSGLDAKDQAEAKTMEAAGAIDAAEATAQQQRAEMGKEIQQNLDDLVKQIINFVKEMKDNEVEMMRAITR